MSDKDCVIKIVVHTGTKTINFIPGTKVCISCNKHCYTNILVIYNFHYYIFLGYISFQNFKM